MRKLRDQIKENYKRRGEDTAVNVAYEDIKSINDAKWKMFGIPIISTAFAYGLGMLWQKLDLSKISVNHLREYGENTTQLRTGMNRAMKWQTMLIIFAGSALVSMVYYEATKYNVYLKYENLVSSYMRAKQIEALREARKIYDKSLRL